MKWKLLLIIMLLFVPLVLGAVQIQYGEDNLTWENITNVDDGDGEGYQVNLQPNTLYYFRSRNDTSDWNYSSQRTKIAGEGLMASLGVIIFVLLIAAAVFYIAYHIRFTEHEWSNFVIKRCMIIFGLLLMSLNTVIVVSISDNAGLGVNQELFRYLWIINWTIYVSMLVLFITTVVTGLKLWDFEKQQKRMGEG